MSLGIAYGIVTAVSVICGFVGMKRPNSKLNMVAGAVMIAGCLYAGHEYTWFHILGMVGITLLGLNLFGIIENIRQGRAVEKARIEEIFEVDEEEPEEDAPAGGTK